MHIETSKVNIEHGQEVLIGESAKFMKNNILKSVDTYWRCAVCSCKAKVFSIGVEDLLSRNDLHIIIVT